MPNEFSSQTNGEIVHTAIKAVNVLVERGNTSLIKAQNDLRTFQEKVAALTIQADRIKTKIQSGEAEWPEG